MNKKLKIPGAIALILILFSSCAPTNPCFYKGYGGGELIHNKKDQRP